MKGIEKKHPHLGGHANITHIDNDSFLYIKEKYNITSAYDIGCGPGWMSEFMIKNNVDTIGIDGDFSLKYNCPVIIHDFTKGKIDCLVKKDLSWSIEFLEHVEEKYMNNYFDVFLKTKIVLCTASQNHDAHHHVNVKPLKYWYSKFEEYGFSLDKESTDFIRNNSSMKRDFVRKTGMVYINNNV